MKKYIALLIFLIPLLLTACGEKSHRSPFEKYLNEEASAEVQEAYEFATSHWDDLAHQPCFCGCKQAGHTSNLNCFAKSVSPDGQLTYDSHAAGCDLCIDIALDVKRLKREGLSPLEIRHYIDAQYSSLGPATDTPMPEL